MVEYPVFLSSSTRSSIVYSPLAPFIQAPTKLWFKTAVLVRDATGGPPRGGDLTRKRKPRVGVLRQSHVCHSWLTAREACFLTVFENGQGWPRQFFRAETRRLALGLAWRPTGAVVCPAHFYHLIIFCPNEARGDLDIPKHSPVVPGPHFCKEEAKKEVGISS